MRIEKKYRIEEAVSTDSTRGAITQPYILPSGEAVATNGRMLVRVPVELEEGDVVGYVPSAAFKMARKLGGKRESKSELHLNGCVQLQDQSTMPRIDLGNFPSVDQVMPKGEVKFTVAFDAALLAAISSALGCDGVGIKLEVFDEKKPFRITPLSDHSEGKAIGVLMPMMPPQ